ncbi:MAG: class I SAM-dependent methyltransferase [Spirochaetia bacterium]
MPSMMEIYNKHAANYDALVNAEDVEGNLKHLLHSKIDWAGKTVYEPGIGTGRVTRLFIQQAKKVYGFDREQHMLNQCSKNLIEFIEKLELGVCDNTDLTIVDEKVDVFIEGWSFGHTIIEAGDEYTSVFRKIMDRIRQIAEPEAMIVIIESLGTNVSDPEAPNEQLRNFYEHMESRYGFLRNIISTDYDFPSHIEAARIMGFFFGKEMEESILDKKAARIPEYTGVWIL